MYVHGADLVKQLGWMSVIDYFCLLLIFKCIHGQAPDYICYNIIMECEITERTTRSFSSSNLHVPYVDNETATKTLMYTDVFKCNYFTLTYYTIFYPTMYF